MTVTHSNILPLKIKRKLPDTSWRKNACVLILFYK